MGPHGQTSSWAKGVFVLIVFALGGVTLAAGGLGLAPVAAVAGVGALAFAAIERIHAKKLMPPTPSAAAWVGAALLVWAAVSLAWSEFDRPANLLRTIGGVPVYLAFVMLCLTLEGPGRTLARAGVLLCVVSAAAMFAFEFVTQGAITAAYRAPAPDQAQVWRNLGHGLSAWVVLAPAAFLLLPRNGASLALGAALFFCAGAGAVAFGLSSNALGLLAALAGGAAGWLWPRRAIWSVGGSAALTVIAAPAFGLLARTTPDSVRMLLPVSWQLRLEAWSYATARIAERPLFGWGFDSSRTMTETIEFGDVVVQVLPLHPHNAGLHLWLETGLVGAALAATLVMLVARSAALAPGLTRVQAAAVAAAAAGYAAMAQVSYGVWQEWWVAAFAWAAAAAVLTGPGWGPAWARASK